MTFKELNKETLKASVGESEIKTFDLIQQKRLRVRRVTIAETSNLAEYQYQRNLFYSIEYFSNLKEYALIAWHGEHLNRHGYKPCEQEIFLRSDSLEKIFEFITSKDRVFFDKEYEENIYYFAINQFRLADKLLDGLKEKGFKNLETIEPLVIDIIDLG
jgi:hypothetical protein